MDANLLVPLVIILGLTVAWLICELKGGRALRIGVGLACIVFATGFALLVMNATGIVIGMQSSALLHVDEGLNRMEIERVRSAAKAYRETLDKSGDPKAAAFAMQQAYKSGR